MTEVDLARDAVDMGGSHGAEAVVPAREAQKGWADRALDERLEVLRRFRHRLAAQPDGMIEAIGGHFGRQPAESLPMEIVPLADACRFLEREASSWLAVRSLGRRGRPFWLSGAETEIRRVPLGIVLVLGPGNYPLFLPGVQVVQALAAGNAVLVKPAPGCAAPMRMLRDMLIESGLPPALFQVLDETVSAAQAAIAAGVDKVILTGSAQTGRQLLAALSDKVTPAILELSGNDPVFVLPGADIALTADALTYGITLNGGATCIAPRRVFVPAEDASALESALRARLDRQAPVPVPSTRLAHIRTVVDEACRNGGRLIGTLPQPDGSNMTPVVVADTPADSALLREDIFGPVIALTAVPDMAAAVRLNRDCPYVLGASIFGPPEAARELAGRIDAGVVTINDVIVPTADPRLPFGGHGESGYGTTRGGEGLLDLTRPKAVSLRRGRFRPHFEPPQPDDRSLFTAYLRAAHGGGWSERLSAAKSLIRLLMARGTREP